MKISFFYDHILEASQQSGRTTAEVMALCRKEGIVGIEINYEYLRENESRVRAELEANGMQISCIYQVFSLGQNPDLTLAKDTVLMAEKFHAERVLAIPGFLSQKEAEELAARADSFDHTAAYMNANAPIQNMKKALTELTAFAAMHHVTVILEDYDNVTAPYSRIWQLLWFFQNVPGLKYALDVGNFAYSDEDIRTAYDVLNEYIVHVHCKDRGKEKSAENGRYRKGLAPVPFGYGYLPAEEILKCLHAQGYDGFYAIEHFGAPDQIRFMQKSARFLQGRKGWKGIFNICKSV